MAAKWGATQQRAHVPPDYNASTRVQRDYHTPGTTHWNTAGSNPVSLNHTCAMPCRDTAPSRVVVPSTRDKLPKPAGEPSVRPPSEVIDMSAKSSQRHFLVTRQTEPISTNVQNRCNDQVKPRRRSRPIRQDCTGPTKYVDHGERMIALVGKMNAVYSTASTSVRHFPEPGTHLDAPVHYDEYNYGTMGNMSTMSTVTSTTYTGSHARLPATVMSHRLVAHPLFHPI